MSWEDQIVECLPTVATKRAIRRGWRAYDESVREYGPSDEWDRRVIAAAIQAYAAQGEPFSCNDFRRLIPEVRSCLISRGLITAQRDGLIVWRGRVTPSTLDSTKAATVKVYVPVPAGDRLPAVPPAPQRKTPTPPVAVDETPGDVALFDLEAS